MELSNDTVNVVNTLKAYSENGLRKENDFGALLEYCVSNSDFQTMNSLLLYGNALTKLSKKLGDTSLPEDALSLVQREFKEQLENIRVLLSEIASNSPESDFSQRITQIYLEETKGGVLNIIDLAGDFALFKVMQSEHRDSRKGS